MREFGALADAAATSDLGFPANSNKPVVQTHDRVGHRTDELEFNPAYRDLMTNTLEHGLHSSPWTNPG